MFVAGFVGAPSMNFIPCTFDKKINIKHGPSLSLSAQQTKKINEFLKKNKNDLILGIRPEEIKIAKDGFPVEITLTEMLGSELLLHFSLGKKDYIVKITTKDEYRIGDKIKIKIDPKVFHIFDSKSGIKIF